VPLSHGIIVRTEDLLQSCPVARSQSSFMRNHADPPNFPWSQFYGLRRRWSHRVVELGAPIGFSHVPLNEIAMQAQMLSYHACRSKLFWKVVGPPELMKELAQLPTAVWGGYGASLYLCQHEIIGSISRESAGDLSS